MGRRILFLALMGAVLFYSRSAFSEKMPEVVKLLPRGDLGGGIKSLGAPEHYIGRKLFDYMDGGAELYLAYGFEDLGVCEYSAGKNTLRAALYKMGSPREAYGIYSQSARGKSAGLPGPSSKSAKMISFFRDRFYVRVLVVKGSDNPHDAMAVLAKKVWNGLPGEPMVPSMMKLLPKGALQGTSRFLTHPDVTQNVWFEGEGKILLSKDAAAVTATYSGGDDDVQLTLAQYPKSADAVSACKSLGEKLGLDVKLSPASCEAIGKTPDDVYAAISTKSAVLRWASGAADANGAKTWLAKIK